MKCIVRAQNCERIEYKGGVKKVLGKKIIHCELKNGKGQSVRMKSGWIGGGGAGGSLEKGNRKSRGIMAEIE